MRWEFIVAFKVSCYSCHGQKLRHYIISDNIHCKMVCNRHQVLWILMPFDWVPVYWVHISSFFFIHKRSKTGCFYTLFLFIVRQLWSCPSLDHIETLLQIAIRSEKLLVSHIVCITNTYSYKIHADLHVILPMYLRISSLALKQSWNLPSANEATLKI